MVWLWYSYGMVNVWLGCGYGIAMVWLCAPVTGRAQIPVALVNRTGGLLLIVLVVRVWLRCGCCMLWYGWCMVIVWFWYIYVMVSVWLRYGYGMVIVWLWYGYGMVIVWLNGMVMVWLWYG